MVEIDVGIDSCRPILDRWAAHKNKNKQKKLLFTRVRGV